MMQAVTSYSEREGKKYLKAIGDHIPQKAKGDCAGMVGCAASEIADEFWVQIDPIAQFIQHAAFPDTGIPNNRNELCLGLFVCS